jgi:DNA-directed RNA polymerase subunit M/transcription elongation factor TFIIS
MDHPVFICPECGNTYPNIEYDFIETEEGDYYDAMKCLKCGHEWQEAD